MDESRIPDNSCPRAAVTECRLITDPAEAERLRPEWDALLARSFRAELTQTPDWMLTWWQAYGGWQGRQLRLGLFHEGGRLIGLAPLLRRRHWYRSRLPFRRLELLASGEPAQHGIYSNHLTILAERGAEQRVAASLVQAICRGVFGSWDEVVLPMLSGDTPMPRLLADAFQSAGIPTELTETGQAPYITLPATWEAYLQRLGASSRRNIQRSQKALDAWADGSVRLESATDPASLDRGREILINLHHARWAGDRETGVFRSPFYLRFHDALMQQLAERGELELHWLLAREEPVAVLYGMAWQGKVYAYQTGRRVDLPEQLRPGAVLLARVIRRAIEAGRREFDLLADDSFYKRQLAPAARPLMRLRAARRTVREGLRRGTKACFHFLSRLGR